MKDVEKENINTSDSSKADIQNSNEELIKKSNGSNDVSETQKEVEKLVENDLNVIRSLVGIGVVTREQGQNLMKQVISNAYDSITKQHELQANSTSVEDSGLSVLDEFVNSNPDFFKRDGRNDVLDYLKNSSAKFDMDELLQISKLIETIEKGAVDRYLKKVEYGKTLNDENNIAKQRLIANAQGANAVDNNMVFTRAQIGKMSGDEFAKYETAIMDQLRRGLIK